MEQTPQSAAGHNRDSGRTHLGPKQPLTPFSSHARKCESRAGPEYGRENMQDQNSNQQVLHTEHPLLVYWIYN